MKNLYLVIGRSSSGKDSITAEVCKKLNKTKVLSYTTRPKRPNEENTHIFIKPEEVQNYKDNIIAYTKIGEFEYFATLSQLHENDFYVIDPKGLKYLKRKLKKTDIELKVIYIYAEQKIRALRALQRGDSLEVFNKRTKNENKQFTRFEKKLNRNKDVLVIYNHGDFDTAVDKVIKQVEYWEDITYIVNLSISEY